MYDELENMTREVASRSTSLLTTRLRDIASSAGWPAQAVQALHVISTGSDLDIQIDPKQQDLINNLEYGTERQPPKAVIRRFKSEIPNLLENTVRAVFSEKVGSLVRGL